MENSISCCGAECAECRFYPGECAGCATIQGKVFWTEYTGDSLCRIYECCVLAKEFAHCGLCAELPCERYGLKDPTLSDAENEAGNERRMAVLWRLAAEWHWS